MALSLAEQSVIRAFVAVNGDAPSQTELDSALADNASFSTYVATLVEGNTQSNTDFVTSLYTNLLGRAPDAEGLDFWDTMAGTLGKALTVEYFQYAAVVNGEDFAQEADDALANLEGKTDEWGTGTGPEPTETTMLTEGRDVVAGTDVNDIIVALVGQNDLGAVSNALSTGDYIDGGAGRDKIEASMISDNEVDGADADLAPRPITKSVEEVYIEALENVTLDATRMENVEQYWSLFSRSDLTINNVSLQGSNLNITKDVTFGLRDTQFDTNFAATFDSQSLLAAPEQSANSALQIRIADVSTQTPATPLANVSVTLGFELDGVEFTVENVVSTDGTYQGLVDAIDTALEAQGLSNLQVALSTPYTTVTVAGNTVSLPFTAQEILITDPEGKSFGEVDFTQAAIESVPGGFLVAGNADPVDPSVTSNLIESNILLDNAGRGSTAGNVVIGGESNSDIGVERFNVIVDRGSKIASLVQSAGNSNELAEIYISSIDADGDLYIGAVDSDLTVINASEFDGANLSIGQGTAVSDLVSFNSTGANANVIFVADYDGNNRASEAQAFTINTSAGNDTITADLTGTSTSGSTTASLTVNSSAGDNTVTLTSTDAEVNVATVVLGAGNDTVTGGATHLTAQTGGGNDTIYAENTGGKAIAALAAGTYGGVANAATGVITEAQLLDGRTVTVTVAMPEETTALAAEAVAFTNGYELSFTFESANVLSTEVEFYQAIAAAVNADSTLNKLVTASVDSNGTLYFNYKVDGSTVNSEELVQVSVSDDYAAAGDIPADLLTAVQAANNDSSITNANVLTGYDAVTASTVATTGTSGSIAFDVTTLQDDENVTFTIDGQSATLVAGTDFTVAVDLETDLAGLTVTVGAITYVISSTGANNITLTEVSGGDGSALTFTATSIIDETLGAAVAGVNTSGTIGSNGSDSTTAGDNSVNGGTGDDVIVLSSNDAETDTVVFDASNIGNDTIVHFEDGATGDTLDFTAFLDTLVSASSSTESQVRVATTLVTDLTNIVTNSVVVEDFDQVQTAYGTGDVTFSTLTSAQLLAALNGTAAGGNAATFQHDATANLVGNSGKAILLIQNDDDGDGAVDAGDNFGEYLVAEVTFTDDGATDNVQTLFTAANIIGTIDLGEVATFNVANFA